MKRVSTFLLGLVVSLSVWGRESVPTYSILSDTAESTVPSGKCRVYGTVTFERQPISMAKVSTVNHLQFGVTDSSGQFSFLMDAKKIALYAFQIGYKEVVTDEYEFKNGHAVQIDFYLREDFNMMMEEKPVIYMYAPSPLRAKVELEFENELTFTYPEYKNGWDVLVNESGEITDSETQKEYPYLFWEGEKENLDFVFDGSVMKGYQIRTDTVLNFLEAKLTEFGLNSKEQTDFITYWTPRISQKPYAVVQFLIDDAYDTVIGKLRIVPEPDCIRRIYLLFAGSEQLNYEVVSVPEPVTPITRTGFTVVEWGGTELTMKRQQKGL